MESMPFTIPGGAPLDLADVEGVARVDGDVLVLEFQTVDGVFGMLKSSVREVRLTLDDLESVSHRRGWLHDCVVIAARRLGSLASIPGAKGLAIKLRCKRRHRKAAESLSLALRLRITDRNLESVLGEPTGV